METKETNSTPADEVNDLNKTNQPTSKELDDSVLDNNEAFVDFSELEESAKNKNKERKAKVAAEVNKEEKVEYVTETNKKLLDALNEDKTPKEKPVEEKRGNTKVGVIYDEAIVHMDEQVPAEKSKPKETKTELVLEEDDTIEKSKKSITVDVAEEIDNLEDLVNTQDEKARSHHATGEDIVVSEFIIDEENKENIIDNTDDSTNIQKQMEIREKIEKALQKRTGYTVYGGEEGLPISLASENPNIKNLRNFDIPMDKIKSIANDDESLKKAFLEQYITMTNVKDSAAVDHRISRFPVVLSGYYAEMTDYSMGEITSVIRIIRNPELKFVRKFQEELVSLYNHISWTSLKPDGAKLTFEEWCRYTKFQDLDMFYFGAYDATYPGVGAYDITCGSCKKTFRTMKTNRALSYMLQNGNDPILKDTFIRDVLKGTIPVEELKKTLIYMKANTVWDEKVIKPHNFRVGYKNPSILDVLEYLAVFEEFLSDDIPDFEALIDDEMQGHNILIMYTLIDNITVPVNRGKNAEGKQVIGFYQVSTNVENDEERMINRRYIIKTLSDLPEAEFAELFTGKELAERKRLKGIQFILHNIKCENCASNISRIPIDMRVNFFTRAADTVDKIELF